MDLLDDFLDNPLEFIIAPFIWIYAACLFTLKFILVFTPLAFIIQPIYLITCSISSLEDEREIKPKNFQDLANRFWSKPIIAYKKHNSSQKL